MEGGSFATNASTQAQNAAASAGPAAQSSTRIVALDVLRGVGVLGMLASHVQLFAFPMLARWNPTAWGDWHGLNWCVWLATSLLADGKFISIFAMLLGASIVMMPDHVGEHGAPAWRVHARRMAALLILGLLHAYLLWYGDMLVPLALCGGLVFVARPLSPRWLLILGAGVFATASVVTLWLAWSLAQGPPAEVAAWRLEWKPRFANVGREILQYRGGWTKQMTHRVPTAWEIHTWFFPTRLVWQMSGLMLMGMALFKLGVLGAARSRTFYRILGSVGFGAGSVLIAFGLWRSSATNWDPLDFLLVGQELRYWGNFLVALGWVGLVMLLCQHGWRLRPVAAVGRTALTNYLLQTLICTTIFYGHGLGLFGRVDRAGQFAIVLAVWAFQLVASPVWLRWFALGPVEWPLRWFVYGRRPSLVRSTATVAEV